MPELLFYCGKTPPPRESARATELRLGGSSPNINRRIEDIEKRMVSEVADDLRDLLDIATYVFIADRMVRRGGPTLPNMGRDWRRRFRLVIAVRDPERWNAPELKSALEDLLGFLSGDDFRFQFLRSDEPPAYPSHLPLDIRNGTPDRYDQVLLFSAGLDSLAGAIDELMGGRDRVVLVSHRSSDRVYSRQKALASKLSVEFSGRAFHVPVGITMKQGLPDVEYTQRTRSFLFFALGCVVGQMMGCDRIRFFENGIMSFNLPIAPQVVGSRATRSTHPIVLQQMTDFASHAMGQPFEVTNPFVWCTKAEVVQLIAEHGQAKLIKHSISCTNVRKKGPRAHCGECAQCLHRRLGILAAGLGAQDPHTEYDVDLLVDDRSNGYSRNMALSLVSNALDYPRLSPLGFMNRFGGEVSRAVKAFAGETKDTVFQRIYELHCRYGREVGSVIDGAIQQYAKTIREKTLPPDCLLRAVIADDRPGLKLAPLRDSFFTESRMPKLVETEINPADFQHTSSIELALDEEQTQVVIDGLGDIGTTGQFEVVSILADQFRADRQAELKPEHYAFVSAEILMDRIGVDSESALRKRISEFRKNVAKLARERWGLPLGRNAVIENRSRIGYRLNPAVQVIDRKQLR